MYSFRDIAENGHHINFMEEKKWILPKKEDDDWLRKRVMMKVISHKACEPHFAWLPRLSNVDDSTLLHIIMMLVNILLFLFICSYFIEYPYTKSLRIKFHVMYPDSKSIVLSSLLNHYHHQMTFVTLFQFSFSFIKVSFFIFASITTDLKTTSHPFSQTQNAFFLSSVWFQSESKALKEQVTNEDNRSRIGRSFLILNSYLGFSYHFFCDFLFYFGYISLWILPLSTVLCFIQTCNWRLDHKDFAVSHSLSLIRFSQLKPREVSSIAFFLKPFCWNEHSLSHDCCCKQTEGKSEDMKNARNMSHLTYWLQCCWFIYWFILRHDCVTYDMRIDAAVNHEVRSRTLKEEILIW